MRVGVRGVFSPTVDLMDWIPGTSPLPNFSKAPDTKLLPPASGISATNPNFSPPIRDSILFTGFPTATICIRREYEICQGLPLPRRHVTGDNQKSLCRGQTGRQPKLKDKVPLMRDEECIEFPLDQRTITRRIADESIRFIKESVKEKKPFFVYLANPMPHTPFSFPRTSKERAPAGSMAA